MQHPPARSCAAAAAAAVVLLAALLALGGCSTSKAPTTWGEVQGAEFQRGELVQSDSNRITQVTMEANLASLVLLADKLYRRNPAEWKKTAATREAALAAVHAAITAAPVQKNEDGSDAGLQWPPLAGQRDTAALSLALSPGFAGDRVAAFIIACADTIITAHKGRRDFYYLNGVDPQYLYNAARNMETALWVLNTRKGADGAPLLYANEMQGEVRNLSFEREFGKIIGRLDLLASYLTERFRRTAINYVQSMVVTPVLGFLPVR